METARLAIGAVDLSNVFTTCVDCFEYVQLGRNCGKDYKRSLLKLDLVKLRLSRWADAVNESNTHFDGLGSSADDARMAAEILREIIIVFANTEKASARYKTKAAAGELAVYNADTDLEPDLQSMHHKMRELAIRRQQRSNFTQKAAWALYEEKHFRRLIEDVTAHVDALIKLFPAAEQRQQQRCLQEVMDIQSEPGLPALEQAAEGVDEQLRSYVQQVIANQGSHSFTKNRAVGEARARYGDEYADEHAGGTTTTGAGHTYDSNKAAGKSRVHYGNVYGGRSVLDD